MQPFASFSRRFIRPSCVTSILTLFGLLSIPAQAADKPEAAPNAVLVRFKASASTNAKARLLAQISGQVTRTYSTGWALTKVPDAEAALKLLKTAPEVAAAEPDYYIKVPTSIREDMSSWQKQGSVGASALNKSTNPNDPYYPQQWNLEKIGAAQAWKTTTGSKDVVVAVMDTGIRPTHEDLKDNLWTNQAELKGKSGVDDDHNGYIDDIYGWNSLDSSGDMTQLGWHGTSVSGIIGATANNGKGITGLNWKTKILSVGVISDNTTVDAIVGGIDYILQLKKSGVNIRVANCSLSVISDLARAAFDSFKALNDAGVLLVVAGNNENVNQDVIPEYPANLDLPNMIVVGASTIGDERADFSGYGLNTFDIFAPGRDILSTDSDTDTDYDLVRGNSFAAPQVTGAAALLWASQPNLSAQAVKERILASATHVDALRPFVSDGKRLNVGALLDNAIHKITGTVRASVGDKMQPVGGVKIYLDGNTATPDAITDSAGTFTLSGIKGGLHKVRAQAQNMAFSGPVPVSFPTNKATGPKIATVSFTAKNKVSRLYSIYGLVQQKIPNQENRPKAGVDVYLDDSHVPFARTDADGKFKVSGLVPGLYPLRLVDSATGQVAPNAKAIPLPSVRPLDENPYSPDEYVVTVFPFQDDLAPVVSNTNIHDGDIYPLVNKPTKFTGTVEDNFEVASVSFYMVRALPDYSIAEIYDGASGTWKDYYEDDTLSFATIAGEGRSKFDFSVDLPDYYKPGYIYSLYYTATDSFGNVSSTYLWPWFYLDEPTSSTRFSSSAKPKPADESNPADKPKVLPPSVKRS